MALIVALAIACTSTVPPVTPSPSGQSQFAPAPVPRVWAYEGALLLPPFQATYENVILDAEPLSDGSWLVIRQEQPRRFIVDPTSFGGGGLRAEPWGRLLRLDASGRIVAEEHGSEPLGLQRLDVFESLGVVVGQDVRRTGPVHVLRIDTLGGVVTDAANCIAVDQRCWSYRASSSEGSTALEERHPRDLHVIRSYPHLTMDGLLHPPAIFPELNLFAWQRPDGAGIRAEALDPSRPIPIPWLDHLRSVCDVWRLGPDRMLIHYGPADCRADTGWVTEIVEASTGRVVWQAPRDAGFHFNPLSRHDQVVPGLDDVLIDPRSGQRGPRVTTAQLPFGAVGLDLDQGIAVIALTNGGAAVLRQGERGSAPVSLAFNAVRSGGCADIDFARLVIGPAEFVCDGISVRLEAGQLAIATGRNTRDPADLEIVQVERDDAMREIRLVYRTSAFARRPLDKSPMQVIQLADAPEGEWLVRLVTTAAQSGKTAVFVGRF